MAGFSKDGPTFWGVWHAGLQAPEMHESMELARDRAYRIAESNVGLTVHLMEMKTNGTVKFPPSPSASGHLAGYVYKDKFGG